MDNGGGSSCIQRILNMKLAETIDMVLFDLMDFDKDSTLTKTRLSVLVYVCRLPSPAACGFLSRDQFSRDQLPPDQLSRNQLATRSTLTRSTCHVLLVNCEQDWKAFDYCSICVVSSRIIISQGLNHVSASYSLF